MTGAAGSRASIAIAAGGVCALALGAFCLLWAMGRPSGAQPERAPTSPPAPPPASDGTPATQVMAVPAPPVQPPPRDQDPPPANARSAPEPDPTEDPSWREIPVTARLRLLGAIGHDLRVGTRRARLEVARCYRDYPGGGQAGFSGAVRRPAALLLHLEARAGEFEVVGASVADPGASPREQVDCVRRILRGYRIPSSTAVPGQRFKVRVVLDP